LVSFWVKLAAAMQMAERIRTNRQNFSTRGQRGFTLLELIITLLILSILVGMAVPLLRHSIKRQREEELRTNLQKLRSAIDNFHRVINAPNSSIDLTLESECADQKNGFWPKQLDCLTKGLPIRGSVNGEKMYFLREIPRDPMMKCKGEDCWGFRSSFQKPEEDSWDGEHIYDVFTKSQETALNETKYKDW
jgi:general secretion pathway protein G